MAATGRDTPGDRDKPHVPNVITGTGDGSDTPKSIANVITCAHSLGQVGGAQEPAIANTITKTKENS